ncbi:cell wall-binding repeat-containing protein [Leifsonia sp. F6_8S_P_1B]|uniref:Cell wall-binding repeat-containing protein n=1 Tax=Leifsonia williamsii TaxID=3035919 RepID=A0ABT8KDF4_9MICO|nr:cell wall-binding repeat-containing protein [Leifsonia williamsii]MDN4615503.1 cell wall-binding repeat-containing protein [Leifsonia williamsii]
MMKKTALATIVVAAVLAVTVGAPAYADEPTPDSAPAATATPTPSPSADQGAPAEPAAPAAADPAPTADPADPATPTAPADPAPTAEPTPTPATGTAVPGADAAPEAASDADPSLDVMDAAGNHTMGSTIPDSDPASPKQRKAGVVQPFLGVSGILGQDVSGWQENVNWPAQWAAGSRFAYVKATEGTTYFSRNQFAQQYNGSASVGMFRGAYHFANPSTAPGDAAAEARWFVANGGGWSPDGRTLPPLLDIEYGNASQGGTCWGMSAGAMTSWIREFVTTMRSLTGINPAIYTTTNWWNTCTGSNNTFGAYPMFVARYGTNTPGTLPAGWLNWTIWQFQAAGTLAGDQDIFNGDIALLRQYALNGTSMPPTGVFDTATVAKSGPFTVTGWAFDQANVAAAVKVRIEWNTPSGIRTTTVSANASRPDVGAAYPGVGNNHGFTTTAPWAGNGQYRACLTALGVATSGARNLSLGCKAAFVSDAIASAPASKRVAGSDRFETAVATSKASFPTAGVPVAYVASGLDFPDALAAAPAAAKQKGPVLLSTAVSIPQSTLNELKRVKPSRIVVVGGEKAISASAYRQLTGLAASVVRVGGGDRYETSRKLADFAFPSSGGAYVATGWGFADSLAAGPVAAKRGQPLILVDGAKLDAGTSSYLSGRSMRSLTVVGGTSVISGGWASAASAAGFSVTRVGGSDRFETSAKLASTAFPSNGAKNVYLASGLNFPDALVAAAAAGAATKPLMLAVGTCVPRSVGDQFVRLGTTSMQVTGGTTVLNKDVDQLAVCY